MKTQIKKEPEICKKHDKTISKGVKSGDSHKAKILKCTKECMKAQKPIIEMYQRFDSMNYILGKVLRGDI